MANFGILVSIHFCDYVLQLLIENWKMIVSDKHLHFYIYILSLLCVDG